MTLEPTATSSFDELDRPPGLRTVSTPRRALLFTPAKLEALAAPASPVLPTDPEYQREVQRRNADAALQGLRKRSRTSLSRVRVFGFPEEKALRVLEAMLRLGTISRFRLQGNFLDAEFVDPLAAEQAAQLNGSVLEGAVVGVAAAEAKRFRYGDEEDEGVEQEARSPARRGVAVVAESVEEIERFASTRAEMQSEAPREAPELWEWIAFYCQRWYKRLFAV